LMCVRRELFPLTATPDDPTHPYLLHAAWTPKLGHALVIVFNYDIYYRPGPRGNAVYRLTEDAVPGVVSNGVPDWVYEGKYTPPYHVQHALSSLAL
jgi:inactive dipeptidyl peptidase 10